MGVLENCCNATFVFDLLASPLAYFRNVDASDEEGCSGIIFLCSNKMNDKGSIESCRYMIIMTKISPVIQFK